MQNYCKTIGALAAASALVAGTAKAEIEHSINGGYHNEYLFRGIQQGGDMVTTGYDIAGGTSMFDLSAGVWHADYDTSGGNLTETDVYGEVGYDLGFAEAALGYIYYIYDDSPNPTDDAQEVYFGLSRELGYGIGASLTYFWDIETDNEGYMELALDKSYELTDCLSLGLATALGYAWEEGEVANWMTTATLDWAFAEGATLSPYLLYVVDGESSFYETSSEQELVGGVNLIVNF
ncbi:MAG: hypothetical protein R3242_03200 [Akkermansiaceae bacterium]|nr:hypothetical protein [Akkermansiaceae bacterium]